MTPEEFFATRPDLALLVNTERNLTRSWISLRQQADMMRDLVNEQLDAAGIEGAWN
jgi:hypothetical protein